MRKKLCQVLFICIILGLVGIIHPAEKSDFGFLKSGSITGYYNISMKEYALGGSVDVISYKDLAYLSIGFYANEFTKKFPLEFGLSAKKTCELLKLTYELPIDLTIGVFTPVDSILSGKIEWGLKITAVKIPFSVE